MSILNKLLGKKSTLPAIVENTTQTPLSSGTAVVLKGEKHFTIYEDGNGKFRAQHKSGRWLFDRDHLFMDKESATKYYDLEGCQTACMTYIKGQMLTQVGTIEFIPSK